MFEEMQLRSKYTTNNARKPASIFLGDSNTNASDFWVHVQVQGNTQYNSNSNNNNTE